MTTFWYPSEWVFFSSSLSSINRGGHSIGQSQPNRRDPFRIKKALVPKNCAFPGWREKEGRGGEEASIAQQSRIIKFFHGYKIPRRSTRQSGHVREPRKFRTEKSLSIGFSLPPPTHLFKILFSSFSLMQVKYYSAFTLVHTRRKKTCNRMSTETMEQKKKFKSWGNSCCMLIFFVLKKHGN